MVDTVGVFYSTPFGIVRTTAWDGRHTPPLISWTKIRKTKRFNNFYEHGQISKDETADWVKLSIDDYPESVDPVLPYSFDLFFDIKTMSGLRRAFKYENSDKLLDMMRNHGVRFEKRRNIR